MAAVSSPPTRQKLSIYAAPPAEIILLDTPSALEEHIGTVRRAVTGRYREAHAHVQGLVSNWIGVEHRVENRIKLLLPPDERLVPGVLYAAIAFLSGAIVARHRALPVRALLPPILGATAFVHFLPKTSANIREYASALEDTHFPEVSRIHETGKAHTGMTWARIVDGMEKGREAVSGGVMAAVEKLQAATGLKIMEAVGVVRSAEAKAERVIGETVAQAENALKTGDKKADGAVKEHVV
ncbi:apolipo protein O-domain-containing protein [Mycena crocata]|nr:apolipo protein O-domain-containing protein [Mycena crocata]